MSELDLLTLSVLMFHPPSLLFPHGHFETTFPSAPTSSNCRRPVKRTSARAARSLATWPIPRTPQLLCESSHPRRQRYTTTFESTNKTPTDSQTGRSADNLKNGLLVRNLHACMDFSLKTDLSQRGHRSPHALHALGKPRPWITLMPSSSTLQEAISQDGGDNQSTIVCTQQHLQENSDVAGGIGRGLTHNLYEFHRRSEADVGMNGDGTEVVRPPRRPHLALPSGYTTTKESKFAGTPLLAHSV